MDGFAVFVDEEQIDAYFAALADYNATMERQHNEAKTAGELRAALCPYPIIEDHSVGACIASGNCGCVARERLADLPD